MLRHPWFQGAFLGTLFLLWMVWPGRLGSRKRSEGTAPDAARCAHGKDVS